MSNSQNGFGVLNRDAYTNKTHSMLVEKVV